MKDIKIVEYNEKYAASVADMWNNSAEGWQGDQWNKTEEVVRNSEGASPYIKLYLALADDEVVGYCKLSEYRMDKETWYIDLLNVRPDYYGKKVGKQMLLEAIDYSIKSGIPRVDLHTWSGNLKAVPLYKKCGFFWEDRDNSVHLINMIPKILKQELFHDFFETADWYNDSTRKIEVVPDGRTEGEFQYWQYAWKKDEQLLNIELCRRGRGIRKIETNDYSITTTIADRQLIFGSKYKIKYEIENKSEKPIQIEIDSQNEEMIKFDFHEAFTVENKKVIEAEFFIDKIDDVKDEFKTQPNVKSLLSIDGKKVLFETGISPQFPVKFSIKKNDYISTEKDNECWISVENMSKIKISLKALLPSDGNFAFKNEIVELELEPKEKKTLKNSFTFNKSAKYEKEVEISIEKNGSIFTYSRDIEFAGMKLTDKLYMNTRDYSSISNGQYYFVLMKKRDKNSMFFGGKEGNNSSGFYLPVPSLGKPYNKEFSQLEPTFESSQNENSISAKITYISEKYQGAKLTYYFELFQSGILKMSLEVDKGNWKDDLNVATYLWYPKRENMFSVDGKIVTETFPNTNGMESLWDYDKIDEKWMMSKNDDATKTFSMVWNDDFKLMRGSWQEILESSIPKNKQIYRTKEMYFFQNVFKDHNHLRQFVLNKKLDKKFTKPIAELLVNNGNPFVKDQLNVTKICNAENKISGKFLLKCDGLNDIELDIETKEKEVKFSDVKYDSLNDINFLSLKNIDKGISKTSKIIFFKQDDGEVDLTEKIVGKNTILTASNGIIELSASPEFAPVVYSMKYYGSEWLDSLFPNPGPKSWWNPWAGGMFSKNVGVNLKSLLKEKNSFDLVRKMDQFGNEWKGIAIKTDFTEAEKFKGTSITQYFMLLPGSPVVARFFEQSNYSGFRFDAKVQNEIFLKSGEIKDTYYSVQTESMENIEVQAGISEIYLETKMGKFYSPKRAEKIFVTLPLGLQLQEMGTNSEIIHSDIFQYELLENDETKLFRPNFIIFSEKEINHNWIQMLRQIEFK